MALLTETGLRINRYCSMADFSIFPNGGRPPSWIFKSWKFQLPVQFVGTICVIAQMFAKIGQNVPEIWPIFDYSRWRPSASLHCLKLWIFTSGPIYRPHMRHCAKFREDRSNRSRDMADFRFPRWRPSAILDLFYACWDHPRRAFGGLCDFAKFGCNRCSNFDSMQIYYFAR